MVDDDAALRLLMRVNLELAGFEVLDAGTLEAAEEATSNGRLDVVLLDVHLVGVDTNALLDRLRADGIPVALVTGSADIDLYRDRADAILTKPFNPQVLVEMAERLARVRS